MVNHYVLYEACLVLFVRFTWELTNPHYLKELYTGNSIDAGWIQYSLSRWCYTITIFQVKTLPPS